MFLVSLPLAANSSKPIQALGYQGHRPASKSSRCRTRANDKAPWSFSFRTMGTCIMFDQWIQSSFVWASLGISNCAWAWLRHRTVHQPAGLSHHPRVSATSHWMHVGWTAINWSLVVTHRWSLASDSGRVGPWNGFQWPVPPVARWMWAQRCWDTETRPGGVKIQWKRFRWAEEEEKDDEKSDDDDDLEWRSIKIFEVTSLW